MTTETNETHVITDLPAPKRSKVHNPFAKKSDAVPTDANETPAPKRKGPYGIYMAGALLVVGGAVAAVASKLGKSSDDATSDVPSDTDNA